MNQLEGRFAARQIPGGREYQEDDYGLIERGDSGSDEVLVIADGMGGQVSGDTASRTVVKTFIETYSDTTGLITDRLRACLKAANNALASAIDAHPELDGMGTTAVAAVISQRGLEWISVGDSPLWLFRDGQLRRLNADHSMAAVFADLVAVGRMTEEEAATDPKRHALRSAVMGDDIHLIDVSSQPVALERGDRVVLASDGLLTLADDEIARILQTMQDAPLSEVAEALIQAVEDVAHPNQDNTTVLLYTPDADKGVDSVIADSREGKSKPDHKRPNRASQLSKKKRNIRVVEIALGVALLALIYWLWPTPSAPPGMTDALPAKDVPVPPEVVALPDTGKVGEELAKKAEEAKKKAEEELAKKRAEEELAKKKAEEERAKEIAKKKAEEELAKKKAEEERAKEIAKKKAEEEEAKKKAEGEKAYGKTDKDNLEIGKLKLGGSGSGGSDSGSDGSESGAGESESGESGSDGSGGSGSGGSGSGGSGGSGSGSGSGSGGASSGGASSGGSGSGSGSGGASSGGASSGGSGPGGASSGGASSGGASSGGASGSGPGPGSGSGSGSGPGSKSGGSKTGGKSGGSKTGGEAEEKESEKPQSRRKRGNI